jgi:hypothetical protein
MDTRPRPFYEHLLSQNVKIERTKAPQGLSTKHAFHLVRTDGHRWLTLTLWSAAMGASRTPYFFGGDLISGEVELNLFDTVTLREINVMVRARRFSDEMPRWR